MSAIRPADLLLPLSLGSIVLGIALLTGTNVLVALVIQSIGWLGHAFYAESVQ